MGKIIKILRITALLLMAVTVITLLTGFLAVKPGLIPWLGEIDSFKWHVVIIPLLFIPLVYIHSLMGILMFFARNQKYNTDFLKFLATASWSAIFALFLWMYAMQNLPIKKDSTATAQVNMPAIDNTQNAQQQTEETVKPATPAKVIPSSTLLNAAEVARHNTTSDCWMIVSGKVYNVSGYSTAHPGGAQEIASYCGKDGTVAFNTQGGQGSHSSRAEQLLSSFYLGNIGGNASAAAIKNVQTATQNIPKQDDDGDDD